MSTPCANETAYLESEESFRARACTSKVKMTAWAAQARAYELGMEWYYCMFCSYCHIGHEPQREGARKHNGQR